MRVGLQKVEFPLTARDMYWLERGAAEGRKWDPDSTVENMIRRVVVYRIVGEAEGIVALSIKDDELFIEAFAGRGIIRHFVELHGYLVEIAYEMHCSGISGFVGRPGLMRMYEKYTKGRAITTLFVEKLA